MRAEVENLLEQVLERVGPGEELSLDELAEIIGAASISYDEIGWLIDHAEQAGRSISCKGPNLGEDLAAVLKSARALSTVLQRRPTLRELAEHSGLPSSRIVSALRYAQVLGR